ncbi:hypothetical protein Kpol_295p3 [Vanderwaltozyma polyspora DSM 70294]|uniref:t-SNARE coiled-coil homology domain-containing protein n=1 Tax=Vanderwaltozyma polyspora (strain ATCC 22028 / DSM 70294 / BCRC 21397 / CBS 2163 / NBRC 10782 / NRRL Y-8283 / UCD 57-17) TaxID=436907 RepID=A7TT17_VANPO|nr:uncharacterized protein Kpol_295p3 [Vanderwaltozyma polyspora DSM 70294]EDO14587.1 hypothetical protein Kpol_295p3 [Vanderwaltozyma polyspora DSM 70294]
MFRDRTNLFLSYRRTFPHNTSKYSTSNRGSKIDRYEDFDDEMFPMMDDDTDEGQDRVDLLPPPFLDLAEDIDEYLHETDKLMKQLSKLYKKNSLPGFEDKSHDEKEIEEISFNVTQLFQKCYAVMKKLNYISTEQVYANKRLKYDELIILGNLEKRYAQLIQFKSNQFRVLQNNYLKFLNKDDMKPILPKLDNSNNTMSDTLMLEEDEAMGNSKEIEAYSRQTLQNQNKNDMNQRYLQERDEEITQLAKGVLEVSTIFREMQNLIIDQGTIVDRIDYNLENTVIHLKEADKELTHATHYQKRTQKCKIILLLSLCVMALFFFVMLKPHGGTTKYETVTVTAAPAVSSTTSQPTATTVPVQDEGLDNNDNEKQDDEKGTDIVNEDGSPLEVSPADSVPNDVDIIEPPNEPELNRHLL